MCKQNDKTKFVPGNFNLNSIATQNTQTACTLQLLRYNLLWGVDDSRLHRARKREILYTRHLRQMAKKKKKTPSVTAQPK